MNFSQVIVSGIKKLNQQLKEQKTRIGDNHGLLLVADGETLTIGAVRYSGWSKRELARVEIPFQSTESICGVVPAVNRKLFKMLQGEVHQYFQMDDEDSDTSKLIIIGGLFRYVLGLAPLDMLQTHPIASANTEKEFSEELDTNAVTSDNKIYETENATGAQTAMKLITVTQNYLTDLIKATKAGLFTRDGRNPERHVLYAAIEEHNLEVLKAYNSDESIDAIEVEVAPVVAESTEVEVAPVVAEPIGVAPVVGESNEAYGILRSQWKEDEKAKTAKVVKQPKVAQQPEEVKEGIYAAKSNKSNPGKKIADLIDLLEAGATKKQICQAFQWKDWNPKTTVVLNYGYTIKAENGVFSIAK